MTVFVVKWEKCVGYDGFSSGIDSIFSTEELALARVEEMARTRPDMMWWEDEYTVDELIKE